MKSSDKKVTLNDVAALSGVSYQTVSRVVNNHPNVAERTRARVMKAIHELDYRPNLAARSLVTNRSNTIAIISFGTTFYGPTQMVANITQQAKANGYRVTISAVQELGHAEVKAALDDIHAQLIDGIIMIAPVISDFLSEVKQLVGDIPFVQIDTENRQGIASVAFDQAHGSHLASKHLIERGHKKIAEISGPLHWYGALMRHKSWIETMKNHDLPYHMSTEGDWSPRSGYYAMQELLNGGAEFTGLIVGNDQMALGAMSALNQAGLSVPGDVSVVGFDDMPEAAYYQPSLTTLRQDFTVLGEQSLDYLVALIKNPDLPVHQRVLYPELVIRNSTDYLTT